MLSIEGILSLLNDEGYKKPDYLRKWCGVYYGMSLHIDGACPAFEDLRYNCTVFPQNFFGVEYQYIFDTHLLNRHPSENPKMLEWRKSVYKPFTQAPFKNVIQTITGAIFQDSGYSITVENEEDNDYIWGNNFHGKSLVQFIQDKFQNICNDPNGVFLTIPKEPYYATTTQRIEPDVWFVPSKFIKYWSKHEIIFNIDEIYWTVNELGYFRFTKVQDKFIHIDEAQGGYYQHLLGKYPVVVAGGEWNSQGFYDSWLVPAKPIADQLVSDWSAKQLIDKDSSHPRVVEATTECPDCDTGRVQTCRACGTLSHNCTCMGGFSIENAFIRPCGTCGGAGTVARNPGQIMQVPKEDMGTEMIQIHTPPIEINKYHAENVAAVTKALLTALHLNFVDQAQSGVAKDKDMETRYQSVLRISNDLFDRVLTKLITDILSLRNVRSINGSVQPTATNFTIVKPTQFQIKTSFDLLAEYKEATESKIPDFQRVALLNDYTDKQFGGDDVLKKKTNIIGQLDPLSVKSDGDIQIVVMNGWVTTRKAQFHYELPGILDTIVRQRGSEWFIDSSFEVIQAEVDSIFAAMIPPPIQIQPEVIDQNRV